MIKSLKINNFRCFSNIESNGFSRINLIGGKNNAGKTALLEALLLMGKPSNKSIAKLQSFRRISNEFIEANPSQAWDNLFYQQKKDDEITLAFELDQESGNRVSITCKDEANDFVNLIDKDTENDIDILEFASNLTNSKSAKSSLNITAYNYDNQLQRNVFVASSNGRVGKGMEHTFIEVNFMPANNKLSPEQLAKDFDKAKKARMYTLILRAFQIIDANIEEVDTFNLGESALYLRSRNEDYMLLSLFGDAMNRIADLILKIMNTKHSILLVDEIENGIHYENQEEVWNMLFSLCKEYDVQLFATSHSYEMIEAFKNCAMRVEYQGDASYFEMFKHPVSHQTTMQKIPLSSLDNKLNNHKPVRGEK